jgi:uncharacterized protein (DUF58 family)
MLGSLFKKIQGLAGKPGEADDLSGNQTTRLLRSLEIKAQRLAQQRLLGRYRSRFKGRGLDFRDFREYLAGDDIRTIDWNVTARFGRPFVKNSEEERELSVVVVLDLNPSQNFGSGQETKLELAQQLATLMVLTAIASGDKVGLLACDGKLSRYIPPSKGRHQRQRVLQSIWQPLPDQNLTASADLKKSLDDLSRQLRRRGFLCLVSDFLEPKWLESSLQEEREKALAVLRKLSYRHEVIALRTFDKRERNLPTSGVLTLRDQCSGRTVRVDTRHPDWKSRFHQKWSEWNDTFSQIMKRARWDWQEFETDSDPLPVLANFLDSRGRR